MNETKRNPLVKIYADWLYYQDFPMEKVPQHLQGLVTDLLKTYPPDPYLEEHRHLIEHVDGLQTKLGSIDSSLSGVNTELGKKVDKVTGKVLSTNDYTNAEKTKLDGIATGANNYTHPTTHPPTIIAQNATNRFVTDAEKTAWNAKETTTGAQAKADAALASAKDYADGLEPDLTGYEKTTDVDAKDTATLNSAKSYADTKVASLVDSAPETLDTLNELSAALGDDPNFATTVANQIGEKVSKEVGKGLSTNDYTTAEKTKLAGVASNANNYVHPASHPASMITGLSSVATTGMASDVTQDTSNRFVTEEEKATWNAKSNFSGSYADLTNQPTAKFLDYGDGSQMPVYDVVNPHIINKEIHRKIIISNLDADTASMQEGEIWIKYK